MPHTHHLHWGAEALWQQLEPLLPGLSVEVVARIGSTNTELMERARRHLGGSRAIDGGQHGEAHEPAQPPLDSGASTRSPFGRRHADLQPCLLVAEQQTAGRGRQGKTWISGVGTSLTFSLSLPYAPAQWAGLSLAVGLAIAEALDPQPPGAAPRIGIKWPNDLLLLDGAQIGRKLGGILIETVPVGGTRMAVIGIGLNVLPQPAPDNLSWGLATVQELQYGLTAPQVLSRVAPSLVQALIRFEHDGFAPLVQPFAQRDVLIGRAVLSSLPQAPQGVADGVDAQGMLWLRQPDGQRLPVGSGEVSLRAAPAGTSSTTPPPALPAQPERS